MQIEQSFNPHLATSAQSTKPKNIVSYFTLKKNSHLATSTQSTKPKNVVSYFTFKKKKFFFNLSLASSVVRMFAETFFFFNLLQRLRKPSYFHIRKSAKIMKIQTYMEQSNTPPV
jgi:hypothetical protein